MTTQRDLFVEMSDGVKLAVRLHLPAGDGPFPTLFGVSPYRFDNDDLPDTKRFLWRETGPIHWYLEQGYAYVRLDVRGSGRSGGDYGFFNARERRDLYEVIEWIAAQPWSSGKVGGIGESYYGTSQWFMAAEKPPHLTCIAPYDGHIDLYNGWAYTGGIPSEFMSLWWNNTVRPINRNPAQGESRHIPFDLSYQIGLHQTYDDFWKERELYSKLPDVTIPVYSIGVWAKMDLHLGGNIAGWDLVKGPKWLMITGAPNAFEACAEFETPAFHERVLLPFYDRYLKGIENGFENKPAVETFVRGQGALRASTAWPPSDVSERVFYLGDQRSGTVESLNDGSLNPTPPAQNGETSYDYPRANWAIGVATLDAKGPDPLREILTFTSPPLERDIEIAGPCELVVHLSSTAKDADLIVRLSDAPDGGRANVITKGWLRASHRQLVAERSRPRAPALDHGQEVPIPADEIIECRVPLMHAGYLAKAGSRLRLEIANGDSLLTDPIFSHAYTPDRVGRDTIHHSPQHPTRLLLSVLE